MAFTLQGYYALHLTPQYDRVAVLSGVATMFIYLLIRVAATTRIREYAPEDRWDFFLNNIATMRIITFIAFLSCVVIYFLLPQNIQLLLFIPGCISLFYGIPIPLKGRSFRLRDIGISKIFMIAFVWAFISSILPAANSNLPLLSTATLTLFAANFLFTFGITIPFDIKDLKIDAKHNVKTIPALLGAENSYSLAFLCLFISGMLHVLLQQKILSGVDYTLPLTISILIAGWSVFLTRKKQHNVVYFGIIDGMLLLQYLLVLAYSIMRA